MSGKRKLGGYTWWPTDYMADEHVALMTLEQEGIYRRLLDLAWLHGSIPADLPSLARLVGKGLSVARLTRLWPGIAPCWTERSGRLVNGRLERERADILAYADQQSALAHRRWQKLGTDNGNATADTTADAKAHAVAMPPSPSPSPTPRLRCGKQVSVSERQKRFARANDKGEQPGAERHRNAAQGIAHIADILPGVLPA